MKNFLTQKFPKFKAAFLPFILLTFMLGGCGKNAELENYKANMNQFFENIRVIDSSINALAENPDSETAVSDLLSLLDSMDTSFAQMASLEVPEGFPGVEELADEASQYMTEAVSYYHQAYDGEYNANMEDVARQNYERANVRFQYIVSIIHGDIPEEIYTYEDDASENTTDFNPENAENTDMGNPENITE